MPNPVASAWRIYRGAPLPVRLHVLVRALTCPLGALAARFPREGTALDVGCGHGLLVHLLARDPRRPRLRLAGIDHDAAKIRAARAVPAPRARFWALPLEALPAAAFDFVSVVDVLYTVRRDSWPGLLAGCRRVLKPGGALLLKEVIDRPRWKHRAILLQETVSVRLLGITKGDPPHFESPAGYARALRESGFSPFEEAPLSSFHWVSHYLILARRR
ncbi:MAG: class I SAM-dependent methyltransferase [Desulfobacterales bacterium]